MKTKAPYGTWISPLHEKQVAEAGVRLGWKAAHKNKAVTPL